jgi:hypothetical protein
MGPIMQSAWIGNVGILWSHVAHGVIIVIPGTASPA